jgi:predicted XRE-type DNA-binding protein
MPDYNFTALTLLLCIFIFWRSIILRRRVTAQSALLTIQTERLEEIQKRLQRNEEIHTRKENFQNNLQQAEVTTELQAPRSSFTHNRNGQRPPERYQYARSMLQSGMQPEEISSALGISTNEISQLLQLTKLCESDEDSRNRQKMPSPA